VRLALSGAHKLVALGPVESRYFTLHDIIKVADSDYESGLVMTECTMTKCFIAEYAIHGYFRRINRICTHFLGFARAHPLKWVLTTNMDTIIILSISTPCAKTGYFLLGQLYIVAQVIY
jgi:hypothetical protein